MTLFPLKPATEFMFKWLTCMSCPFGIMIEPALLFLPLLPFCADSGEIGEKLAAKFGVFEETEEVPLECGVSTKPLLFCG